MPEPDYKSMFIIELLQSDCTDLKAVIETGLEWARATRNHSERERYEKVYKKIFLQVQIQFQQLNP